MRILPFVGRHWLGLTLISLLTTSLLPATAQTWSWAAHPLGTGNAQIRNATVDAAGNAYVVGHYSGSITCGTQTLTTNGDWDMFVGKLSATGQWQWVKRAGRANSTDIGYGVAVDRTGNVYLGGQLTAGNYTFDALTLQITSVGCASYAFVGKLSATGQWQWVKGSPMGSVVSDLVTDPTGNVCAVGLSRSASPFEPAVAPFGDYAFATKLSPTGALLWNAAALVNGGADDVAVDRTGNFYLGGHCKNAVTIGPTALPALGRTDGFVAKLSSAGQWQWAQRVGSTTGDDAVTDVAVDATGNVYAGASLNGRATVGTTVFAATGSGYGVVAKCSPTGQWLWAVRPEAPTTTDSQWPTALTIDAGGSLHVLGSNRGSTRFGTTTITTPAYLARLNATDGTWQWAQGISLTDSFGAQTLASGPTGALWLAGYYLDSFQLGSLPLTGGTNYNALLGRMAFAAPTLSSLSPASGAVGSTVTLNGTNLHTATSVKFGTRAATYTVVSPTRLTVTVPAGATTGTITVTNTAGSTVTSATIYTVVAPTLTSFSPAGGPVGTTVTINGTGFTGATGVRFNATLATSFTVVSATRITAVVPAGATTGRISVLALGGTKQATTNFSVSAARPAPAVAAVTAIAAAEVPSVGFSLYPNPASKGESIRVEVPAGARRLDVFDANGLPVRSLALPSDATPVTVPLTDLRPGSYTIRCGQLVRRLLVE